jgi:hypothetical protein
MYSRGAVAYGPYNARDAAAGVVEQKGARADGYAMAQTGTTGGTLHSDRKQDSGSRALRARRRHSARPVAVVRKVTSRMVLEPRGGRGGAHAHPAREVTDTKPSRAKDKGVLLHVPVSRHGDRRSADVDAGELRPGPLIPDVSTQRELRRAGKRQLAPSEDLQTELVF